MFSIVKIVKSVQPSRGLLWIRILRGRRDTLMMAWRGRMNERDGENGFINDRKKKHSWRHPRVRACILIRISKRRRTNTCGGERPRRPATLSARRSYWTPTSPPARTECLFANHLFVRSRRVIAVVVITCFTTTAVVAVGHGSGGGGTGGAAIATIGSPDVRWNITGSSNVLSVSVSAATVSPRPVRICSRSVSVFFYSSILILLFFYRFFWTF